MTAWLFEEPTQLFLRRLPRAGPRSDVPVGDEIPRETRLPSDSPREEHFFGNAALALRIAANGQLHFSRPENGTWNSIIMAG
jgi:hypothetical protein